MKHAALLALFLGLFATPVLASATLFCESPENDDIEALITMGRDTDFAVVGAIIGGDGWLYATHPMEGGEVVELSRASRDGAWVSMGFVLSGSTQEVVTLKLVMEFGEDAQAIAGALWAGEGGLWPVICGLE